MVTSGKHSNHRSLCCCMRYTERELRLAQTDGYSRFCIQKSPTNEAGP